MTEPEQSNVPADAPWWARWWAAWWNRSFLPEWARFLTWLNTYLIGTLVALPGMYEMLPAQYQMLIPTPWLHWIEVAVGVATFVNMLRHKPLTP